MTTGLVIDALSECSVCKPFFALHIDTMQTC
jgi:hypothetical protein